jgi:protein-tyrosine phosphatase
MAEAMFNVLAKDKGLSSRAESAGTAALVGRPMASKALAVLEEVGIYPGAHHARQVSRELVADFELVLTMSPQQAASLRQLDEASPSHIHSLPVYASDNPHEGGVPDPYGHSIATFRACARQLRTYIEYLLDRLE